MKSATKIVKGSFFYFNLLFIAFILLCAFSQNAVAQALPKDRLPFYSAIQFLLQFVLTSLK